MTGFIGKFFNASHLPTLAQHSPYQCGSSVDDVDDDVAVGGDGFNVDVFVVVVVVMVVVVVGGGVVVSGGCCCVVFCVAVVLCGVAVIAVLM